MVLGLRSKHQNGASIQLDYVVHVLEIKPWSPSLTSEDGEVEIEFNESFMLPLTLCRDKKAQDKFQKNYLQFHLYEPRKVKAQLLGTAIVNLADYGVVDDILTVSAPFNLKKSSKVTAQPVLFVKIQPTEKYSSNPSSVASLSKQVSLDKDVEESELANKEIDDDSIASFTDDDQMTCPHILQEQLSPLPLMLQRGFTISI